MGSAKGEGLLETGEQDQEKLLQTYTDLLKYTDVNDTKVFGFMWKLFRSQGLIAKAMKLAVKQLEDTQQGAGEHRSGACQTARMDPCGQGVGVWQASKVSHRLPTILRHSDQTQRQPGMHKFCYGIGHRRSMRILESYTSSNY